MEVSIDLKMNNLDVRGNTTEFKTTDAPMFTSIYIDLYVRDCNTLVFQYIFYS